MAANTVQEMINILEEFPLDTQIKDSKGRKLRVQNVYQHHNYQHSPCLLMGRDQVFDHQREHSGTVLELLTFLIGIATNDKFNGGDTRVLYTIIGTNDFVEVLALEYKNDGPVIRCREYAK